MADHLQAELPALKIFSNSGYTDDAIACHLVLEEGIDFLAKPYFPVTLIRRIRDLLDASR
jgi:two-component system, cell cycle sensor histidine kinase and response regulator CckA